MRFTWELSLILDAQTVTVYEVEVKVVYASRSQKKMT